VVVFNGFDMWVHVARQFFSMPGNKGEECADFLPEMNKARQVGGLAGCDANRPFVVVCSARFWETARF
jgi:hypothetical protein